MAKDLMHCKLKQLDQRNKALLSDIKEIKEDTTNQKINAHNQKIDILQQINKPPDLHQIGVSDTQIINCDRNLIEIDLKNVSEVQVVLYIDSREVRNQQEREYFESKITERGIKIRTKNLAVGDFLWVYELQDLDGKQQTLVSDYLVERKQGDDLGQSIIDGRYKEQKRRIKKSGLQCCVYLIEGSPINRAGLTSDTITNAITNTMIYNGIKIKKTQSSQQTVEYIVRLHHYIETTIQNQTHITSLYTYQQFEQQMKKTSNLTVNGVFQRVLNQFPTISKKDKQKIIENYQTFQQLYQKINSFNQLEDVYMYLNGVKAVKSKVKKQLVDRFINQYQIEPLYIAEDAAKLIVVLFYNQKNV